MAVAHRSIRAIDSDSAKLITAGQVIVGLSSVVKELVENSVDAKAREVIVTILDFGLTSVTCSDNGEGFPLPPPLASGAHQQHSATQDESEFSPLTRRASSKFNFEIVGCSDPSKSHATEHMATSTTLGFRGEALFSLAQHSDVCIETRSRDEDEAILREEGLRVLTSSGKLLLEPLAHVSSTPVTSSSVSRRNQTRVPNGFPIRFLSRSAKVSEEEDVTDTDRSHVITIPANLRRPYNKAGTTVHCYNLFRRYPVRLADYVKNRKRHIVEAARVVKLLAIAHPEVRIILEHRENQRITNFAEFLAGVDTIAAKKLEGEQHRDRNRDTQASGKVERIVATSGSDNAFRTLTEVIGGRLSSSLQQIKWEVVFLSANSPLENTETAKYCQPKSVTIEGFISKIGHGRASGEYQMLVLDGRIVGLPRLFTALTEVYRQNSANCDSRTFPAAFLWLHTNNNVSVDVNLAPNKEKIIIEFESEIVSAVAEKAAATFRSNVDTVSIVTVGERGKAVVLPSQDLQQPSDLSATAVPSLFSSVACAKADGGSSRITNLQPLGSQSFLSLPVYPPSAECSPGTSYPQGIAEKEKHASFGYSPSRLLTFSQTEENDNLDTNTASLERRGENSKSSDFSPLFCTPATSETLKPDSRASVLGASRKAHGGTVVGAGVWASAKNANPLPAQVVVRQTDITDNPKPVCNLGDTHTPEQAECAERCFCCSSNATLRDTRQDEAEVLHIYDDFLFSSPISVDKLLGHRGKEPTPSPSFDVEKRTSWAFGVSEGGEEKAERERSKSVFRLSLPHIAPSQGSRRETPMPSKLETASQMLIENTISLSPAQPMPAQLSRHLSSQLEYVSAVLTTFENQRGELCNGGPLSESLSRWYHTNKAPSEKNSTPHTAPQPPIFNHMVGQHISFDFPIYVSDKPLDLETSEHTWTPETDEADTRRPLATNTEEFEKPAPPLNAQDGSLLSSMVSKKDFFKMRVVGQFNRGFIVVTLPHDVDSLPSRSPSGSDWDSAGESSAKAGTRATAKKRKRQRENGNCPEERARPDARKVERILSTFIVDQHASDEKCNYERLLENLVIRSQPLLRPVSVHVDETELELAIANQDELAKHGFLVSREFKTSVIEKNADEGACQHQTQGDRKTLISVKEPVPNSLLVTGVPILPYEKVTATDVLELTQQLITYGRIVRKMKSVWHSLATKACRSSIMIGKTLEIKTMERILRRMGNLDQPWACPHGRPTMRFLGHVRDKKCPTRSPLAKPNEKEKLLRKGNKK